ncbi:hypothetical protein PVAP13_9KG442200 [Panicum virgatum]|uniref:Uncharacterized protein n=1 Tax=Panicum virgatum TaxID=38727 RepID=A0A8T0NQX5_PANVG|nr:hypothetical protein PVAP13_9KG442200 [Panicum virgatum]KAG2551948.1 hypothetical protein PVAP13_9KG442200 [Panicum virgatum]
MSAPVASSGSQDANASQSVGSRPQSRPCPVANSATATQPSDSTTPASDSAIVGNIDVVEIEDDASTAKKRKLRFEVWKDFDLVSVNGVWKAKCHWCKKHLGGETRNGTTHLKNQLLVCEDRITRKVLTQSTLKLSANPKDGMVTLEKYVFDQDVARKELALMIIVHEYPLSMVDHIGFHKFCATLQPAFKLVPRNTVRNDILDMYQVQKQSMVNYIKKLSSRVAVITDLWTANHQRKSYMAVTAHFLDDDWKLKSFLIK